MNRIPYKTFRSIAWALYGIGIAIIVASYAGFVTPAQGWIGWGIGMTGWLMFQIRKFRSKQVASPRNEGIQPPPRY